MLHENRQGSAHSSERFALIQCRYLTQSEVVSKTQDSMSGITQPTARKSLDCNTCRIVFGPEL